MIFSHFFSLFLFNIFLFNFSDSRNSFENNLKVICSECNSKLVECTRYPFLTTKNKKDLQLWAKCMEKPFEHWRKATEVNYWPNSKKLTEGPVGGFWYGRLECFEFMVGTPRCVTCGVLHFFAYQNLEKSADFCWDAVNPVRKNETLLPSNVFKLAK